MPSVVIAAHNEQNVIGSCLEALGRQEGVESLDVVVSANGCTDDTVAIATRFGVKIVDRPEPGKPGAMNAGDAVAVGFPRIYLDADIIVPPGGVRALISGLSDSVLAVVPRRRINLRGRSWPVRSYFAIYERLPAFRNGLFGRGMIAIAEAGRGRFDTFPSLIADDLFLDSNFFEDEKAEVDSFEVVVEAPYRTRDLLRRLVRVRRGNAQMRAAAARGDIEIPIRPSDQWAWLRDVVVPHPRLVLAALPYAAITITAALLARRGTDRDREWGRDESTRSGAPSS